MISLLLVIAGIVSITIAGLRGSEIQAMLGLAQILIAIWFEVRK